MLAQGYECLKAAPEYELRENSEIFDQIYFEIRWLYNFTFILSKSTTLYYNDLLGINVLNQGNLRGKLQKREIILSSSYDSRMQFKLKLRNIGQIWNYITDELQ